MIGHVCQESRSIVLGLGNIDKNNKRWFAPSRDLPYLHWTPLLSIEQGYTEDLIFDDLAFYARHGGVAGIPADRLCDIYPVSRENPDFTEIGKIKEYLVAVEVVVLHLPLEMVTQSDSGLFGRLGEEAIKLVDVADTETILEYRDLWASSSSPRRDSEPEPFFTDLNSLQTRVRQWLEEVEGLWLRSQWHRASENGWHGMERPQDIWLGPGVKEDRELKSRLASQSLGEPVDDTGFEESMHRFRLNEAHPFVQKVLKEMPSFQPRIMFRHCHRNCHIPKLRWRRPPAVRGGGRLR